VLTFSRQVRIHLATAPVDFRKGHFGLSGVVRGPLAGDPLQHVWVFYNARRTDLKLLWFEHGGFVLAHKKLARGRYRIPEATGPSVRMTSAELGALLEGIDLSQCLRLPRWNPPEAGAKT
jgi:transposase